MPPEILSKIFLYLNPFSLHNARIVCSKWNTLIKEHIWKRHLQFFKQELKRNWTPETSKYSTCKSLIQVNKEFSFIAWISQKSIILAKKDINTPIFEQTFMMIDLLSMKTLTFTQKVDHLTPISIQTNDEIALIYFKSNIEAESIMKIWSISLHRLIKIKQISKFHSVHICNETNVVILFQENMITVISISNNEVIEFNLQTEYTFSEFEDRFLQINEIEDSSTIYCTKVISKFGRKYLIVWKIDINLKRIIEYLKFGDNFFDSEEFEESMHVLNGQVEWKQVHDVFYHKNHLIFLIIQFTYRSGITQCSQIWIKICNHNGLIVKKVKIPNQRQLVHTIRLLRGVHNAFFIVNRNAILLILEKLRLNRKDVIMLNMDQILSPNPYILYNQLNIVCNMHETTWFQINKTSFSTIKIQKKTRDALSLEMNSLNFWSL